MSTNSNTDRLIVIEGLDGSGKATQAALLAESLTAAGTPVRRISFPDYAHKSSIPVQMYLNGEIGSLEEVNAYAASTFYSIDRYISYQTDWSRDCKEGRLILADRYTTSNACHQMVKLPQAEWDGYLDWLADLEYSRMGLPEPGMVLYLDMDPNTSRRLLEKRYGGGQSVLFIGLPGGRPLCGKALGLEGDPLLRRQRPLPDGTDPPGGAGRSGQLAAQSVPGRTRRILTIGVDKKAAGIVYW